MMAVAALSSVLERVVMTSWLFVAMERALRPAVSVDEERIVAMTVVLGLLRRASVKPRPIPVKSLNYMHEKGAD